MAEQDEETEKKTASLFPLLLDLAFSFCGPQSPETTTHLARAVDDGQLEGVRRRHVVFSSKKRKRNRLMLSTPTTNASFSRLSLPARTAAGPCVARGCAIREVESTLSEKKSSERARERQGKRENASEMKSERVFLSLLLSLTTSTSSLLCSLSFLSLAPPAPFTLSSTSSHRSREREQFFSQEQRILLLHSTHTKF